MAFIGPFLSPKKLHITCKFQAPTLGANFHHMCEWLTVIYFTQEIHNCFLEILSSDEYSKKREFLETQNVILASGDSLLVSRNSIHSSFDSRVETVNLLLSGTEILHSQGHNV